MTTVAFDGKMLVADSRACAGNTTRRVRKIFRLKNGNLFGCSGEYDSGLKAREWLDTDGEKPAKPSLHESFAALLVTPEGCFRLEPALIRSPIAEPFAAVGSGRDFAIAAMHLGKTAREALEVALLFDANTGGPIDVMMLASEPALRLVETSID